MAELLSAAQADADARDRELMNLKMEVAHLRERLLMRVGGDATAAELELENFSLKTALVDAEGQLADTKRARAALDAKYAKALSNLVKLDHAWKSSLADAKRKAEESEAKDATIAELRTELDQRKQRHDDELVKRQTLVNYQQEKIDALEKAAERKDEEQSAQAGQQERLTLKIKELESELVVVRERQERGSQQQKQSVAKSEFEALQTQLQDAKEQLATLRGETNALRDERASLQTQLSDTKASLTAAMAKFLQLKEDNATLEVRVAAANEKSEQSDKDAAFYKSEVDRIQSELSRRDEELLQLERTTQVLELKLSQQQKLTEDAVQVRDHEAKRLELKQELTWKDREFELEKEMRAIKQQCEAARADTQAMRQLHDELRAMLASSGGEQETTEDQDLKTLVSKALARNTEAAFSAQQQQRQVARLEKELAKMKALEEENASLKAEYEKTRTAMERIVGRRTKATSNSQRFAGAPSTSSSSSATGTTTSRPSSSASATTTSRSSIFTSAATPATVSAASTSINSFITQRRTTVDKFPTGTSLFGSAASSLVGTKRKLDLPSTSESQPKPTSTGAGNTSSSSTPSSDGPFSPRTKRLVHVASRYLQSTKNAKR